jgi:hypothetical protein
MLTASRQAAWVAAFCFVVAFVGLSAMKSSQQAPHDESQPTKTENRDAPLGNSKINEASGQTDKKRKNEDKWYDTFRDHPTDWLLVLFNGLLVLATIALFISGEKSADAAKEAAGAAKKSADVAERTLTELERPYIFVDSVEIIRPLSSLPLPDTSKDSNLRIDEITETRENPEVQYTLKNYGRTPAIIQFVEAEARLKPHGNLPIPKLHPWRDIFTGRIVLKAGDPHTWIVDRVGSRLPRSEGATTYFVVQVTYFDVFNWVHIGEFTFFFMPNSRTSGAFVPLGGNESNRQISEKWPDGVSFTYEWVRRKLDEKK